MFPIIPKRNNLGFFFAQMLFDYSTILAIWMMTFFENFEIQDLCLSLMYGNCVEKVYFLIFSWNMYMKDISHEFVESNALHFGHLSWNSSFIHNFYFSTLLLLSS